MNYRLSASDRMMALASVIEAGRDGQPLNGDDALEDKVAELGCSPERARAILEYAKQAQEDSDVRTTIRVRRSTAKLINHIAAAQGCTADEAIRRSLKGVEIPDYDNSAIGAELDAIAAKLERVRQLV